MRRLFKSAGIPIRPFEYLDVPILIRAMHTHDIHPYHDVRRFAYDASHVTMTSPAFTFHLSHIEMKWHDIMSVHIVGTPHHHGSHHMGKM